MDFVTAVKTTFQKSFQFNGRASRAEFWWFRLFAGLTGLALVVLFVIVAGVTQGDDATGGGILMVGIFLYIAVMFFPYLSSMVRRLHDSDKSGWLVLIDFLPLGGLVLLVFYLLPGTKGKNKYGADPYGTPDATAKIFE